MGATIVVPGRLGKDAELRYFEDGSSVLNFSLATNIVEKKEKTTVWYNCSIFGKRGEALAPYLTKGTFVAVTGEHRPRQYEYNGETRTSEDVRVDRLEFGGGKREEAKEEDLSEPEEVVF
ncbi:MAG TPA: single-stranded DNA-binding protein [Bellilinea sp.]|nr:single-stranded DNA-binding protein [Bellilinea sp.]